MGCGTPGGRGQLPPTMAGVDGVDGEMEKWPDLEIHNVLLTLASMWAESASIQRVERLLLDKFQLTDVNTARVVLHEKMPTLVNKVGIKDWPAKGGRNKIEKALDDVLKCLQFMVNKNCLPKFYAYSQELAPFSHISLDEFNPGTFMPRLFEMENKMNLMYQLLVTGPGQSGAGPGPSQSIVDSILVKKIDELLSQGRQQQQKWSAVGKQQQQQQPPVQHKRNVDTLGRDRLESGTKRLRTNLTEEEQSESDLDLVSDDVF